MNREIKSGENLRDRRAALYMRMSTERQEYSLANQAHVLFAYAEKRQIQVVRTYSDAAKSGLTFEGRSALKKLIEDVQGYDCPFEIVLTYDVSRWGRFQDVDEAAYYEQICKRAGVQVIYCAECFYDYEGPMAGILKNLKRAMAAEYSRELSVKISQAHRRLAEQGYHQCGKVGFGLRRVLIDGKGETVCVLTSGQHHRGLGYRTIVRPGPKDELKIVRRIFREFTMKRRQIKHIMEDLNTKTSIWPNGKPWNYHGIRRLLTNENYIGNTIFRPGGGYFDRPSSTVAETTVRCAQAFSPIVPVEQFRLAADIMRRRDRTRNMDDEAMLNVLREIYAREGKITTRKIVSTADIPKWKGFASRFGSMTEAYRRAGLPTVKDCSYISRWRTMKINMEYIMDDLISVLCRKGDRVVRDLVTNTLCVSEDWVLLIKAVRAKANRAGKPRWAVRFGSITLADICLIARFDEAGEKLLDMYLLPMLSARPKVAFFGEFNELGTQMYQIQSVAQVPRLAKKYLMDLEECTDRIGRRHLGVERGL
jgi:DNA invertase Pin-like site-specific DNA recombinase